MISKHDAMEKNMLLALNKDAELTFAWLEDTLYPSINLMALKSLIFDLKSDVELFESKNGKSDKTKKSLERANKMLDLVDKLDKVASQNNTAQLLIKHCQLDQAKLMKENKELKEIIESNRKVFEDL